MKKNTVNQITEDKKIIGVIAIFIILIIGGIVVTNLETDNDNISRVTKILSDKYDSIKCINSECSGIIATTKNKDKNENKIYSAYGKLVAKYNDSEKNKKIPYDYQKKYILMQKKISDNETRYYMVNTSGKVLYKTNNKLIVLNENYVLEQEKAKIDYVYKFIDLTGKVKYENITDYKTYDDNKFISMTKEDKNYILNSKGQKIVDDCKVENEVKDEKDRTKFLIVQNTKNDSYYYFNTSKSKIVGDSFESYKLKSDNSLVVYKKENNSKVSYNVNKNGIQKKASSSKFLAEVVKDLKSKLDENKFYIYTLSVLDENQDSIFVDNKEEKSFGIYNLKDNKYTSVYNYSSDKFYSSISVLESNDDKTYFQVSCSNPICSETQMLVYNFSDNKELFKLTGDSLVATEYSQYENGYKVIKYSYKTTNNDYKGKYVLYDKDNKELYKSSNQISIIDSKLVMGKEIESDSILYSTNKNKILNDEKTLAEKLDVKNKNYYKYRNNDLKNVIINSKGNEIYSVDNSGTIEYNNDNIFAITSKDIKIYNMDSEKVSTYRFSKNETTTDYSNSKITPFGSVAFVNNSNKSYVKVIDSNANVLKQIKKTSIYKVEVNKEHTKAFIITTSKVNGKVKYGLYLAK